MALIHFLPLRTFHIISSIIFGKAIFIILLFSNKSAQKKVRYKEDSCLVRCDPWSEVFLAEMKAKSVAFDSKDSAHGRRPAEEHRHAPFPLLCDLLKHLGPIWTPCHSSRLQSRDQVPLFLRNKMTMLSKILKLTNDKAKYFIETKMKFKNHC